MSTIHTEQAADAGTTGQGRKSLTGGDGVYRGILMAVVAIISLVVVLFVFDLGQKAIPGFKIAGWGLFGTRWDFGLGHYGALPLVLGTLVTSTIALLFAVPVGIATALAILFVIPQRLRLIVSSIVELLAVVPSIVYGIWGIRTIYPWLNATAFPHLQHWFHGSWPFNGNYTGFGVSIASIVLAIMVLPIITAVSRDVISAVPKDLVEGALSLGATRSQVIRKVILPTCRTGLVGAVSLAAGRALGETIALATLMGGVTLQSPLPDRLFATGSTLSAEIANQFGTGIGQPDVLFALGFVLMVIVGGSTYVGRVIVSNQKKKFQ